MCRFLLAALLLSGISNVTAQNAYQIGQPPAWVKVRKPDLTAAPVRSEGWEYVLVDRQEAVDDAGIGRYWHTAYRVLDQAAVNDNSQIEIVFDPIYQRLTLHAVTVWRGGRALNQLKSSRIRVAQRETNLEERIFDGSLTVVIVLEDVRAGDVIEYSFTRTGSNPVFRGHYMASFQFAYDAPLAEQYMRLLWRRERPVNLRTSGAAPQPTISANGAFREYEWLQRNVPAVVVETDVPDWFNPYATVQVSDFGSWREVAAWGDSLFADATLPPALRHVVEQIRAASESDERRVLQALRWVQDEIRYTGVEIGVNSHQPYSPAVVIKRRYGDCKDKALLLITMLRALGIDARPALVSTTFGGRVVDYAPTAALFDHVIVEIELNGRPYWIDPTDVDQRGDISDVAAYYGSSLILGPSADSLTSIPDLRPPTPTTDIVASFDIGEVHEPATMSVETSYSGSSANQMRSYLKRSSREELQQRYVEYYGKLYPSIRSNQLPVVRDDEVGNVVRLVEHYTIGDFWTGDSTDGLAGKFEPLELSSRVPSATATGRRMPLAVSHPIHMRYVINARRHGGWVIRSRHEDVATPAANFKYGVSTENDVLTLSYEYETLADHVMPAATTAHSKGVARVADLLAFRVTPPQQANKGAAHLNWSVLLAAVLALVFACMGAVRVSRSKLALAGTAIPVPTAESSDARRDIFPPHEELEGLGGWLILVGIGITLSPVRILVNIVQTLPGYGASTWSQLTTPGSPSYHALWAPGLLIELVANITLFVAACLLVYLFYRKKRQFPIVFGWVILLHLFVQLIDALIIRVLPVNDKGTPNWAWVLPAVIWVVYMLRSRRVRNTFVN